MGEPRHRARSRGRGHPRDATKPVSLLERVLRDSAFRSGTSGRKAGKGSVLLRAALGQRPIVGPVRHSRLYAVPLPGILRDERSYAGTDGQQAASPKGERQGLGRA